MSGICFCYLTHPLLFTDLRTFDSTERNSHHLARTVVHRQLAIWFEHVQSLKRSHNINNWTVQVWESEADVSLRVTGVGRKGYVRDHRSIVLWAGWDWIHFRAVLISRKGNNIL